jgi:hypothetical protein
MRSFFVNQVKPILIALAAHPAVKQLVVDLLTKYAKTTDTQIDDVVVVLVKQKLFPETK